MTSADADLADDVLHVEGPTARFAYRDAGHGFLFQHHADFAREVLGFLA